MTWDQRKCSLFTPKTNRAISPTVKYMKKMGPGKSVHYEEMFTNQECSLQEVSVSLYIVFMIGLNIAGLNLCLKLKYWLLKSSDILTHETLPNEIPTIIVIVYHVLLVLCF